MKIESLECYQNKGDEFSDNCDSLTLIRNNTFSEEAFSGTTVTSMKTKVGNNIVTHSEKRAGIFFSKFHLRTMQDCVIAYQH